MGALGSGLPAAVREGRAQLALSAQANQAPTVGWQGLQEPRTDFDQRMRQARAQLPSSRILIAACSGPHPGELPGVRLAEFPPKLFELLHPAAPSRYRVASGGRSAGKSHAFAQAIVLDMVSRPLRVLCAREKMNSLRESVHHLLIEKINALGLWRYFEINDREISCPITASEVIFAGLFADVNRLRSLEGVQRVWIEESESVSKESLSVLEPTIREADSEIWMTCNPDDPDAPVQGFIGGRRPDARHVHVTWRDNPWHPQVLEDGRKYLASVDPDEYAHVWEGECRRISDAQVFAGKYTVEEFTPVVLPANGFIPAGYPPIWDGPFWGCDWGFAQDPTTLIKAWINERTLYIENEAYGVGVDIDRTPELFDQIPGARNYTIRADNARPETINYMQRHGYGRIVAAQKWPNSVTDGISVLRSFERIVIHPRCVHTIAEFRNYSYRTDRLTGDVMPELKPGNDHCIDALRYGLQQTIRKRKAPTITELRW